MTKVITFTRPAPNDILYVTRGVINTIPSLENITEEEALVRARIPYDDAYDIEIIDEENLPKYDEFRNGWKRFGSKVGFDMDKCREIARDTIRVIRKSKLEVLDISYIRADEEGNTSEKKRISEEKQKLRDAPDRPEINAAITIEDLREFLQGLD